MNANAVAVSFHGNDLFVIEHNGQPYTPMKPIVEGMGLTWQSQHEKLKQRFNSTITEIVMVASDGKERLMTCLALRKLPAWLYSVHTSKIKPELRAKVIMYQNECDDVLWDYWTKGQAINKRAVVNTEQKSELQQIVAARCGGSPKARGEMWTRHNNHFNIHSYHELLAIHFEDAKQYLTSMVLKTKLQPQPQPHVQTTPVIDQELLRRFVVNMHFLRSWWAHYHAGIKGINPHAAASVH